MTRRYRPASVWPSATLDPSRPILNRSPQDGFDFVLSHSMPIDMRLPGLRVDVVTDVHADNATVPGPTVQLSPFGYALARRMTPRIGLSVVSRSAEGATETQLLRYPPPTRRSCSLRASFRSSHAIRL